jgi:sialic acid synthase SpsE
MKVIIEIAKSHEGNIEKARDAISTAAFHGFWAVKFQSYDLDDLNKKHPNYERNKKCHLSIDQLEELKEYAQFMGINFFCSAFSLSVIEPLSEFTDIIKMPSTYFEWDEFYTRCAKRFGKVIISTGFQTRKKIIERHQSICTRIPKVVENIFFHCVSKYPTRGAEMDRAPHFIKGLSYHGTNLTPISIATAQKYQYIEVHYDQWKDKLKLLKSIIIDTKENLYSTNVPSAEELANYEFYKKEFNGLRKALK